MGRNIIVIGASAGGLEPLARIFEGLPRSLPAAVFVVVHSSPTGPGLLADLLDRRSPLTVRRARDGEEIRDGRGYVAPPDRHLILRGSTVHLSRGPRENGFRPAVDPLFRSAARAFGSRVVGVILSGGLDDGTAGLLHVKRRGGIAVVQDPDEALMPSMPQSALRYVDVDHRVRAAEIPDLLARLARDGSGEEVDVAEPAPDEFERDELEGRLMGDSTPFSCPECGGALRVDDGDRIEQYHCHVGHRFTSEALVHRHGEELEAVLWHALRALEESAELRRRMAGRARRMSLGGIAERYDEQAAAETRRADLIRRAIGEGPVDTADVPEDEPNE